MEAEAAKEAEAIAKAKAEVEKVCHRLKLSICFDLLNYTAWFHSTFFVTGNKRSRRKGKY